MIPLVIRPGFISSEYVQDKRAGYVPPLRLYLFISIFALLLVNIFVDQLNLTKQVNGGDVTVQSDSAAVRAELENAGVTAPGEINFGDWLDAEEQEAVEKRLQLYTEEPRLAVKKFFSIAPQLMFIMLPLFALTLKLLYVRSGRYFMEHLVLALHTHAFLLLMISLILLLSLLETWWLAIWGNGFWLLLPEYATLVIWIWMPVYLFLAQRAFYQQSWVKTTIKYLIAGNIWMFLMMGLVLAAIIRSVLVD